MNTKKDIKSGYSFLYRKGGFESEIIEIILTDRVKGVHLRTAFDKAILRFPYLRFSVIEENGDFRLKNNRLRFKIKETKDFHVLGSKEVNYHLIDVTFWENSIFVAFNHGLCDGRGIKPFVETLLFNYLRLRFRAKIRRPGGRFTGQRIRIEEYTDPFAAETYSIEEKNFPEVNRDGFALPETGLSKTYYKCRYVLDCEELMKVVKECKATPAIYVALLFQKVIKSLNPDAEKPIICNMASDMRAALDKEETFKNCVSSIYLPYTDETEKLSIEEQANHYRQLIREQKNPDYVKRSANGIKALFDKLDAVKSFKERQEILNFFNGMQVNTFVLSYIGQFDLKGSDQYVKSAHLYCSGSQGMVVNLLSIGDSISIEVEQSFADSRYSYAVCKALDEAGLHYEFTPLTIFETPKDGIHKSLAMSENRNNNINRLIRFEEKIEQCLDKMEKTFRK